MKRVFLYNPENDIALGYDCERFTPPRNAAFLSRYGAPVMWWLGTEGDVVLVPEPFDASESLRQEVWHADTRLLFGAGPDLRHTLVGLGLLQPSPWGWSRDAVRQLSEAGVASDMLDVWRQRVPRIRQLSHRRISVLINSRIAENAEFCRLNGSVPFPALEAMDMDTIVRFADRHGEFYVKSPWSSSGRGVVRGDLLQSRQLIGRCESVIRSQGSVMLEPAYRKILDFAMLFEAKGGAVSLHGYSLFFNSHGSSYGGNLVASDEVIKQNVAAYVGMDVLDCLENVLSGILGDIVAADYDGYMGVDMMVAQGDGGGCFVVPCVELNLRMTMGVIAHAVACKLKESRFCDGEWLMRVIPKIYAANCPGSNLQHIYLVPENDSFDICLERMV